MEADTLTLIAVLGGVTLLLLYSIKQQEEEEAIEEDIIEEDIIEEDIIEDLVENDTVREKLVEDDVIEDDVIEDDSIVRRKKVVLDEKEYHKFLTATNKTNFIVIGEKEKTTDNNIIQENSIVVRKEIPIGPSTGMVVWEGVKYTSSFPIAAGKALLDVGRVGGEYISDVVTDATYWTLRKGGEKIASSTPGLLKSGWDLTVKSRKYGGGVVWNSFLNTYYAARDYIEERQKQQELQQEQQKQQEQRQQRQQEQQEQRRRRYQEQKRLQDIRRDKKEWLKSVERSKESLSRYVERLIDMRKHHMIMTEEEIEKLESMERYYWEYKSSPDIKGNIDDYIYSKVNRGVLGSVYDYLYPPMIKGEFVNTQQQQRDDWDYGDSANRRLAIQEELEEREQDVVWGMIKDFLGGDGE